MIPSPQQQAVIDWALTGRGSLNLIARAGCGKTSTLLMVVEALCAEARKQSYLPRIFLGAYNKAIAEEIKAKLAQRGLAIDASTMHSAGFALWRNLAPKVKVDDKKMDAILYQICQGREELEAVTQTIRQLVSLAKQTGIGFLYEIEDQGKWFDLINHFALDDIPDDLGAEIVVKASMLALRKSIQGDTTTIDFDDMIYSPLYHKIPCKYPYDWVLLDEAQDTNAARRALALRLLKPQGRLVAVGDDRQAIYGFTGADADAMDRIKQELGSSELPLNVTYRCPKQVVKEAQRYVPDIHADESAPQGRVEKATKNEVGRWIIPFRETATDAGDEPISFLPSDVILCRLTAPLIKMAYDFIRKQVPCRVEGRDIGKGLLKLSQQWKVRDLQELEEKLDLYLERERGKWLARGREEKAQQVEDKVQSLFALIDICHSKGHHHPRELGELIDQMFGDTRPGERQQMLTLSTIHKSKGREWPRVFILGANKYMPSPYARKEWQLLQEKNLSYVAITRAQQELVYLEV